MTNHGTALRVTPSIERDFHSAVIAQLPDLSDEEMQQFNRNKGELGRLLREALVLNDKPAVGNLFSITCEGDKASELVKRGKYNWTNDLITDKLFPIKSHSSQSRTFELVRFDHNVTSDEALAEFARRDLKRPTYEDALVFGINYPEEQRKHPVVFLHEPVDVVGDRSVLVLFGSAGGRRLNLGWFDGWWDRVYVFAGLRK